MNHIYKTIWNATLGTWTAVQETAKSHGKSSSGKVARAASRNGMSVRFAFTLVASALLLASGQVMAVTGTGQDTTDIACFFDTTSLSVVCGDASTSVVDTYGGKQAKAVAVGLGATTTGESNVALGANSSASHTSGLAIGAESKAHHNQTVAIGERANALGEADVSVGKGASEGITSTGRNVAIGEGAVASIYHQVSGQRVVKTQAEANNVIGIGTSAAAGIKGSHNIAMGAHANSEMAIATALANGVTAAEIGATDRVTADNTIALGQRSLASKTAAVAVGQQAKALGGRSAAIGNGSKAGGENAVAAGSYATATGTNSVAIGGSQNNTDASKTLANAHFSVAIGSVAQATATGAIAMGQNAVAAGKETVSLGAGSGSKGVDAANATSQIVPRTKAGTTSSNGLVHMTNIGYKAGADNINNNYGVNIGYEAGAGGYNSYYGEGVSIGNKAGGVNTSNAAVAAAMRATSQAQGGVAADVIITGNTNTAISSRAGVNALGHDNVAIGKDAGGYSSGNNNVAIGRNAGREQAIAITGGYADQVVADAFGKAGNTIAVGEWAHASADHAAAIGTRAKAGLESSVAFGKDAKTTGIAGEEGALAIGRNAHADGQGSTAMGINARSAKQSIAIGTNANNPGGVPQNIGASSVAIGNNTSAEGTNTVALGNQSTAKGDKATALGFDTKAEGQSSVVIGDSARNERNTGNASHPHADQAVAVGVSSNVNSLGGVAVGSTTKTTGVYGTAVGIGSVNNTNFGVALGALSTTDNTIAVNRDGYDPLNPTASADAAILATKANAAGVSVGGKVLSTQGSGPGQTAVRPDGVNDGDIIRRQIHNVAAGTDDTDAVNVAQLKAVGNALSDLNAEVVKPLTFIGDASISAGVPNEVNRKLGETLNIIGKTTAIKPAPDANDFSVDNIGVFAAGNNLVVRLAKNVDLGDDGSVKTGNTTINNEGVTIAGGPSNPVKLTNAGLNNGGNKITNVANGEDDGDAVNMSQLKALQASKTHFYSVNSNDSAAGNYNNDGATGGNALAAGVGAQATHISSTAVGHDAKATNDAAVAIGWEAEASGNHTIALGGSSQGATGHVKTQAQGDSSMAIGFGAQTGAGASWSIAQGDLAKVGKNAERSMAVGVHAAVADDATDAIAVGNSAKAGANFTVAVGLKAQATASGAMAQGNGAVAAGVDSLAHGKASQATADYATAVGNAASAGEHATAVGNGAAASGASATAFGTGSKATGGAAAALGNDAKAEGWAAVAVGRDARASNTAAVAIGTGARAAHEHSVALGSDSTTAAVDNTGRASATVGGINYSGFAADAPTSMVSVGRDETTIANPTDPSAAPTVLPAVKRTITHVAAGRIAADSTDAINGSQLHATQAVIGNVADSVKDILGGNAAVGGDGKLNMTNIGGTGKGNIHDAIQASRTTVSSNNSSLTVNKTTDGTTGADNYDLSINAQGLAESAQLPVVYTKADGAKVYKHTDGNFYDAPNGGGTQVPTGNVIASMQNADGTTAAPTTLANVKAGVNATDAVNVSQLQGAAAALGGGAGIDPATGAFITPSYTITKTDGTPYPAVDNVGAALGNLNAEVVKPLTITGNTNSDTGNDGSQQTLGSTLAISGGLTDASKTSGNSNIRTVITDNKVDIQLADAPIFVGTVTAPTFIASGAKPITIDGTVGIISGLRGNLAATTSAAPNPTTAQSAPTGGVATGNAATVGDVLNAGWNLQTNGAAVDFVRPYDTVNFAGGKGATVSTATDGATTTVTVDVNAQAVAESAHLPVVYTQANGSQVYKHGDGYFYDQPEGTVGAQQVDPANIIASMQNATGSTATPTTLANVKAGVNATDAVNVSQLQGAATALGGGAGIDPATGAFTAPNYVLTDGNPAGGVTSTYNDVGAALSGLNTAVTKPLTFAGDSGSNIDRKLGSTLSVKGGATGALSDGNIGVVADGANNTLNIKLAQNIDLGAAGSVKTGNTTVNNAGITINEYDQAGAITKTVSLTSNGLDNGGNKISNVADGAAPNDAVNFSQLQALQNTVNSGWSIGNGGTAPVAIVKPGSQVDFVAGNSSTKVDVTHDATNGNSKVSVSAAPGALQYTGTNNADGSNTPNADQFMPTNQVTLVGAAGNTGGVTINNVAPAELSATSKQAVNGSQLHAVGDSTAAALGGTSTFDPATGTVTAGLSVGGATHASVQDALNAINTTAGAGWNLQANGGAASNVPSNGTVNVVDGSNTKVTLNGNELKVDVVDNPTFSGPVTANGGLTVAGNLTAAPNTNVDMGSNIIHNVANGVADTDAANMGQLRAMSGNITNITHQIGAVDARVTNVDNRVTQVDARVTDLSGRVGGIDARVTDVTNLVGPNLTNPDGTKGLEVYDVSKQTLTEHKTVIEALNQVKREGTKYSHTQDNGEAPIIGPSNAASAGALASTATGVNAIVDKEAESGFAGGHRARVLRRGKKGIAVGHEAVAGGESAVAVGDGAEAHGDQSLSFGTKNRVYADRSGAIGDPTTIIASATDSYSIGNNNTVNTADTFVLGNNVVTSVANSVYLGAGAAATAAPTAQTAGMATYNAQTIEGVTHHYAGGTPTGVVSVGDVGQERRIQNVAAGLVSPTSTDAINGSQLYQTSAAIGNLSNRINVNHDKAMGGIASAMASAGLPQAYLPGKSMIAMGVGAYQGRSAVAVGVSTISDNGRWIIKGSVNANDKGNVGATLGAGYQW